MVSQRIEKVNELIKRELSKIILEEINLPKGVLLTIIKVETAKNLSLSKVYISVIPKEKTKEVFVMLKNSIYNLQQLLNKRLRMRPIPRIKFSEEKQVQKIEKIEEILDSIKK